LVGNAFFSFKGRVVNIDGAPVVGATVTAGVVTYNFFQIPVLWGTLYGTTKTIRTVTAADGTFVVRAHGTSLDITSIEATGFDPSTVDNGPSSFSFPASPAQAPTYVLAPLGPSEGNVKGSSNARPPRDGRPFTLDFTTGREARGDTGEGDLRFTITGPAQLDYKPPERFTWSVTIAAVDGELVETQDPVSLRAPDGGYRPSYTYRFEPANLDWKVPDPAWGGAVEHTFYVRSRHGKMTAWCKLVIKARTGGVEDAADVDARYIYNPQGSPNLFRPTRGQ
jgi:hypothetical protein